MSDGLSLHLRIHFLQSTGDVVQSTPVANAAVYLAVSQSPQCTINASLSRGVGDMMTYSNSILTATIAAALGRVGLEQEQC